MNSLIETLEQEVSKFLRMVTQIDINIERIEADPDLSLDQKEIQLSVTETLLQLPT